MSKKATPTKQRGPGRPPSKPPAPAIREVGIVTAPNDASNRLEFVYKDPNVFKVLFTYFKNVKAREIHLRCDPRGMTFFARDHSKTSRIVAHVSGAHVNWYYCEEEFWLWINRENVEKLIASIDKSFYMITILQTHEDPNSLTFIFKDAQIEKECNYKVTLSSYPRDQELYDAGSSLSSDELEKEFPIAFTLTARQLKKTISDASNYSESISFEKYGPSPLQITYAKSGICYNEVYRSPEKIQLWSSIRDKEIFRATIQIAHVKSLASSMVTDDVRILCREKGDILFRSAIDDKVLVVSTFTTPSLPAVSAK